MKNVWLINHYAISMYENKGGRHYWFAQELIRRGYNVTIICSNQFHAKDAEIELEGKAFKIKERDNIRFIFVKSVKSKGNGGKRVLNMLSFYHNLMKNYKKFVTSTSPKPDIVLGSSVHPLAMVAGIKIGKKFNIPKISEVRDLWPEAIFSFDKAKENSFIGKVLVSGERWIYRNSDALIFTKEGDKDYIIEKKWDRNSGGDIDLQKCFYINNGVNLKEFDTSSKENILIDPDLEDNKFKVIYAGALRPVNNVSTIIEAAKHVKEYTDIQFLIYGQGIEADNLKKLINDYGLTNVKLNGFVKKTSIPFILSQSSLNILNYSQSKYNWTRGNSSNKLFEYMASGKPVISNVKMGYCLLERYKCGYVTKDNTGEALANEILKVYNLHASEYRMLCEKSRAAAEDFDFSVLTDKLEDVFLYAANKRGTLYNEKSF